MDNAKKEHITHPFKDDFVKLYTIEGYSGLYSSLKDEKWANGGHFEFSSKDEEKGLYLVCFSAAIMTVTSLEIPPCDRIYPFNELYSKTCTISYYSDFYSSLKDKNCAYGGHFDFVF